ncbi:MAG: hypothetical protein IPL61_26330 [Myxococcales bacterium]|nr:hypothetical protein [Myxococcales bacterium]
MKRTSQRLIAASCVAALVSGCAVTRQQRKVAVISGAVFTGVTAGYAFSRFLAHCDPSINGSSDQCEADRIDDRNFWGGVSLLGLIATIGLQLLPVTDPERPEPTAIAVKPPPAPPASANALHSPMAVQLADRARTLAAAGKCVEAFGSLKALATVDRPLADQLRAWDPTVSRCRTVREAWGSDTAIVAPVPTSTAPTAPAGPGALPPE